MSRRISSISSLSRLFSSSNAAASGLASILSPFFGNESRY